MPEPIIVPLSMHGARGAIARGLTHIDQQVQALEQAVEENTGLAFDLSKTLIESVCRTVLSDRDIPFADKDELPKLIKLVSQHLPFLPATASDASATRASLKQTLSGLSTTVQGICELRNQCGFASHGSDGPRPVMEALQARLAAEAADAIVGFLYGVHREDRKLPSPASPPTDRSVYDANPEFNEAVDEAHGVVRIFDLPFQPSDILFQIEPESYRIFLTEFDIEKEQTLDAAAEEET